VSIQYRRGAWFAALGVTLLVAALTPASASASARASRGALLPTAAASVTAGATQLGVADFGFAQGWRVDRHLRVLADITGDGRADIVGFGNDGVIPAVARGDGTFQHAAGIADFGWNQGWRPGEHPRFVTDITGDGRADIVAVGNSAVYTAVALGNGSFGAVQTNTAFVAGSSYFVADVNADNRSDLYRFGADGRVDIMVAQGNGTFAAPILAATGFFQPRSFDNIQVVDVTGDHRAEIVAFSTSLAIFIASTSPRFDNTYPPPHRALPGAQLFMNRVVDVTGDGSADLVSIDNGGVFTAVSVGSGNFNGFALGINDFSPSQGWTSQHPINVVDVTGDRAADMVGFGNAGVWFGTARGDGTFQPVQLLAADFGRDQGWDVTRHVRIAADITGDGRADLVGFGEAGVWTAVT
jgi:hypothetical protein